VGLGDPDLRMSMEAAELAGLLKGETDLIEWKESARQAEDVLHPACAMANDLAGTGQPGWVIYGVKKNGDLIGVDDRPEQLDELQQQISNRLTSTAIVPVPSFDLTTAEVDGKTLVVLRVFPYPVPPVVSVRSVPYIRKGTTTRRATDADLTRLRERRPDAQRPFDSRPVAEAEAEDLDLPPLQQMYQAERADDADMETFPSFEGWLTNRKGLGQAVAGTWRPNGAAILLYGRSPQDWFPGAVVEFVRYGGRDLDAPVVSRRQAGGALPDQLEVIWAQVEAHLDDVPHTGSGSGVRESYAPRYPIEALKELVRNLVQHRLYEGTNAPGRIEWYDDRIEFSNPGGPFGRASEGEFGDHSDYRNPLITKELVELGYVQKLGRGIRRARLLLERAQLPPLEVETDGFTRIIVRSRP